MQKTLPKGHTSCLTPQFKYTSATHTDLGKTFARIKQQLKGQSEAGRANVCALAHVRSENGFNLALARPGAPGGVVTSDLRVGRRRYTR